MNPSPTSCFPGETAASALMRVRPPLAVTDAAGRQRLAEYLIRAPFSVKSFNTNLGLAMCSTAQANIGAYAAISRCSAPTNLYTVLVAPAAQKRAHAALLRLLQQQVPRPTTPGTERPQPQPAIPTEQPRRPRPRWRQLIIQVWGSDPLQCPHCRGQMRLIEVIEKEPGIRKTLEPLGLWAATIERRRHPPRHAPPHRLIDAKTGQTHPVVYADQDPAPIVHHPTKLPSEPLA